MMISDVCCSCLLGVGIVGWYLVLLVLREELSTKHRAQSTERTRAVRVHGAAHGTLRLKSERA